MYSRELRDQFDVPYRDRIWDLFYSYLCLYAKVASAWTNLSFTGSYPDGCSHLDTGKQPDSNAPRPFLAFDGLTRCQKLMVLSRATACRAFLRGHHYRDDVGAVCRSGRRTPIPTEVHILYLIASVGTHYHQCRRSVASNSTDYRR